MGFDEGFSRYVSEVSTAPKLTEKEERTATQAELICSHLGLAIHIAKRYAKNVDELMERVQDANVGLCQAAAAYDNTRGRFSACAQLYIRAAIRNRLTDRFGKPLRERKKCDAQFESWDAAGHEATHEPFAQVEDEAHLAQISKRLTPKQWGVLRDRLRGDTLAEIAERNGTSHQAVRSLEQTALRGAKSYVN